MSLSDANEDPSSRPSLSVAALRRASPLHSPTRTLRLTEAEHAAAQQPSRLRVTAETLARPRSNPRSRTPMRYESPLTNEFQRAVIEDEEDRTNVLARHEARRITIRPLAGTAVGTSVPVVEERRRLERSRKQGPSTRKVRRWHNDHLVGVAEELAAASERGRQVAAVLREAQKEAHRYRAVHDFTERQSEPMDRFLHEEQLRSLRERFFEGEIPSWSVPVRQQSPVIAVPLSNRVMLARIDSRLRRIVSKACANSLPAEKVVRRFECFVLRQFQETDDWVILGDDSEEWTDLLLRAPKMTQRTFGSTTVEFYFDPDSSTGGFHRLLLHAVCQFHGLQAVSRVANVSIGKVSKSRALFVQGSINEDYPFRLVDAIGKD